MGSMIMGEFFVDDEWLVVAVPKGHHVSHPRSEPIISTQLFFLLSTDDTDVTEDLSNVAEIENR